MSIINIDFILNIDILYVLLFLIIFSFTNGFILFPASQAILIFGGLLVSVKNLNFLFVFSILVVSNFLGNYLLYFISFKYGENTARLILPIRKKTFENHLIIIDYLFKKYGSYIIFIGRNLPVLHSLVSVPASVAKVNSKVFSIYTMLGISTWSVLFMGIGMYFGDNYEWFLKRLNIIGSIVSIILLGIVYYFFKVYMKNILYLAKKDLENNLNRLLFK